MNSNSVGFAFSLFIPRLGHGLDILLDMIN